MVKKGKRSKVEYVWVDYVEGDTEGRMRIRVAYSIDKNDFNFGRDGFRVNLKRKCISVVGKVSREEVESEIRRLLDVTKFRWENKNADHA